MLARIHPAPSWPDLAGEKSHGPQSWNCAHEGPPSNGLLVAGSDDFVWTADLLSKLDDISVPFFFSRENAKAFVTAFDNALPKDESGSNAIRVQGVRG